MDGVVGGGQAGYNWQMDRIGFSALKPTSRDRGKPATEALCAPAARCSPSRPVRLGSLRDTVPFNVAAFPMTSSRLQQKIDWFGTVRGRIGVLAAPKVLLYVTGGLAYGEVDASNDDRRLQHHRPQASTARRSRVRGGNSNSSLTVGWTLGAGVEGVISGNWTAELEYLYHRPWQRSSRLVRA